MATGSRSRPPASRQTRLASSLLRANDPKAVDGDVRSGLGRQGGPNPISMPALKFESRQLGHKVELCGPNVAVRRAEDPSLSALTKSEMVRHELLAQQIVGVDADIARF